MRNGLNSKPKVKNLGRVLKSGRSKVSNGKLLLPDLIDGRSALARRYKDISNQLTIDQGGAERLSETRLQLVRRFAACAVLAEQIESRLVNGEQIDVTEHSLLCSTLVRLAARIGLDRKAKELNPSLDEYLGRRKLRPKPTLDLEAE